MRNLSVSLYLEAYYQVSRGVAVLVEMPDPTRQEYLDFEVGRNGPDEYLDS